MNDKTLYLLLQIYNDAICSIGWKYQIKLKEGQALSSYSWYNDLVNLYNIIHSLGVKPRDYVGFQVNTYKPPTKFGRKVPTIRMLTSLKAVEAWEKSQAKPVEARIMSDNDLILASKKYMLDLMHANNMSSEEDFFKDPFMLQMVSKSFLASNSTFMSILNSGYYSRFGLTRENLI